MLYVYETNLADFKAAQRLHRRCHPKARLGYVFWYMVFPAIGCLSGLLLVWDIVVRHFQLSPSIGGLLSGLTFGGLYCLFMRPYLIRRAYRQMKEISEGRPVELELRDGELISRVPGRSEGRFQPKAVLEFVEDEQLALLYIRKKLFLIVPKRGLPESDLTELRAWSGKAKQC